MRRPVTPRGLHEPPGNPPGAYRPASLRRPGPGNCPRRKAAPAPRTGPPECYSRSLRSPGNRRAERERERTKRTETKREQLALPHPGIRFASSSPRILPALIPPLCSATAPRSNLLMRLSAPVLSFQPCPPFPFPPHPRPGARTLPNPAHSQAPRRLSPYPAHPSPPVSRRPASSSQLPAIPLPHSA